MPAGKCRRPTRKRQREGKDDDTQTRAHRTASGRKSPPCGTSHTAQGGHAKKARSFREKTADFLQKTPNFRARTPGFCPPALRRTTKQRKHRTSTGGRAPPNTGRAARSPRCATSHCAAPPSRNETLGCRRATECTIKRPFPLENRKGRSGVALHRRRLALRQRAQWRDQDLRSNSWRFSRRLVSRNS